MPYWVSGTGMMECQPLPVVEFLSQSSLRATKQLQGRCVASEVANGIDWNGSPPWEATLEREERRKIWRQALKLSLRVLVSGVCKSCCYAMEHVDSVSMPDIGIWCLPKSHNKSDQKPICGILKLSMTTLVRSVLEFEELLVFLRKYGFLPLQSS